MFKLSIIIPVYNVEPYIYSCLTSVVNQKNVNPNLFEVIVVDDGSPDRSIDIINSFDWRGINHTIISQKNKGLSGARNTGMNYASGEYIWFVDSDDIISSLAIDLFLKNNENADLINIGHRRIINGIPSAVFLPKEFNSSREVLINGFSMEAPFHIFKKSLLDDNNLHFVEGIYHEDMEFTPRCIYLAQTIVNIRECFYDYQIRGNSIMTTLNAKRAFDNLIVADSLIKFSVNQGESLKSTPLSYTICLAINNAFFIISQSDRTEQNKWNDLFCKEYCFVESLINSNIIKYKIEGYILKYIPVNKVYLYKAIQLFNR